MKKGLRKILFTLILVSLVACTSSLNKTNFESIQAGMTMREVIAILGKPTGSTSMSFGDVTGTSAYWENRNGAISILFFNDRVKLKRFVEGVSTPRED